MDEEEAVGIFTEQALPVLDKLSKEIENVHIDVALVAAAALTSSIADKLAEMHIANKMKRQDSESTIVRLVQIGDALARSYVELNVNKTIRE